MNNVYIYIYIYIYARLPLLAAAVRRPGGVEPPYRLTARIMPTRYNNSTSNNSISTNNSTASSNSSKGTDDR